MQNFADIFGIGTTELIIVVVLILLLFGGSQLPKLFRNAGASMHELKKGMNGEGPAETPTKPQETTNQNNQNENTNQTPTDGSVPKQ